MDINALKELAAKVEAGEEHIRFAECLLYRDRLGLPYHGVWAERAYQGSLDAAKTLHEALLPGWEWRFQHLDSSHLLNREQPACSEAHIKGNAARAWLLAILRALIAENSQ